MQEKRPFLLLEVLVSVLIALGLVVHFISIPFYQLRQQREWLLDLERERRWEWALMDIKIALQRDCSQLPREKKEAQEKVIGLDLPPFLEKKEKITYSYWCRPRSLEKQSDSLLSVERKSKKGKGRLYQFLIPG